MSTITRVYRSAVPASPHDLYTWHAGPAAFERLTPPWMRVRVMDGTDGIDAGDWKQIRVSLAGPVHFDWKLKHAATSRGHGFVDVQQRGPFKSWRHEHHFRPDATGGASLEDILTYELPWGGMIQRVASGHVEKTLDALFRFRHERTRHDLSLIMRAGLEKPLRVAVTGASGLVGRRLVSFLEGGGHEVLKIVRRTPRNAGELYWNPTTSEIDAAGLEGLDAVVHLAGVSIAGGRWTRSRKTAILSSRIDGTHLLARTLADLEHPPRVFVSTSAVGYYGDAGEMQLTEEAPAGEGFLANVCRSWEQASRPAAIAGIRVINPRFGLVLAGDGGMLPLIAKAFQAGVGGPLGSGDQYMSWIAIDDLVGVLFEAITNDALSGPVNAVSPQSVTSREFAQTLGSVLNRPSFFRAPATAMRLVAGELADELILASQRVIPARLMTEGFDYQFRGLEDALRHELGRYVSLQSSSREAPERRATGRVVA